MSAEIQSEFFSGHESGCFRRIVTIVGILKPIPRQI